MSERADAARGGFWGDVDESGALQRYRTLVNTIDDGLYQLDDDGNFVAVNDIIVERTGYARDELLGEHVSLVLDDDDVERIEGEISEGLSTGREEVGVFEVTIETADGDRVPSELRVSPLLEDGTFRGTVGVARDISDRKRRKRRIETAMESYETITDVLDEADVGVFVLDESFDVAWVDETACDYFGLDRDAAIGRDKRELIEETIRHRVADGDAFADTVLATYDDNSYDERFDCRITAGPGREERWLEHRSRPIESDRYAGGRVELYYDITEQRRRATQLRRLNEAVGEWLEESSRQAVADRASEHLHEILDMGLNGIYLHDPDSDALVPASWTESAERLLEDVPRFEPDEGVAWRVFESGEPAFHADVSAAPEVYDPDTPIGSEMVLPIGDHGVAIIGSEERAAFDEADRMLANVVASSLEAIFDRLRHERDLERERDLTDRILDTIPAGGIVLDADGEITRINDRAAEILDVDDPEAFSLSDRPAYDEDGRRLSADQYPSARVLATGDPVYDRVLQVERPDGERRWLSINAVPITDEDGEIDRVVTAGEDITDLKERERELESELSEVFGRVSDAFYAVDEEYRFTHVNERAEELLDATEADLRGRRLGDVYPETPEIERIREHFDEAMESQEPTDLEHYSELLDRWIEATIHPSESGVSVYFRDVTERKERERELRESEAKFRTLAENLDEIVWMSTPDTEEMLYINPVYEDVWGRDRESLYEEPHSFLDGVHPDDRERVRESYTALPEESYDEEFRVVRPDGSVRWLHAQGVPVRNDGEIVRIVGIAADVTERKERERELREANAQLEAAMEAGAVGTWQWYVPEDRFVAGPSFARTFDVDPDAAREGVSADRFADAIHENDRDRVDAVIEEALESCGEYEAEYRVRNADGELRWLVARGHVECDEDGEPVRFPGAVADITERKRTERELQRTKRQLETLIDVLPVGVVVAESDGALARANDAAREIWGGDVFDASGVPDYDQYTGWWADSGEPVTADEWTMARVLDGETVTDPDVYEIETADGERRTIAVRGMPIRDTDGEIVRGVVTQSDVTERREYRRKLETSERRHRTLVENFPDGAVALFDEDLEYTAVGGHYFEETGVDPDDRIGNSVLEIYPDDLVEELEPHFRATLAGEEREFEVEYNDRHLRLHTVPVEDASGEIYAGMIVAQDVTERREYQRKLEESNERLEQFAYAVSHDLQEPLRMVTSYLQLLERRYENELDEDGEEFIEFAVDGAERMKAMIDGLLEYSRVTTRGDPLEPVDLERVIDDVLADLQFRIEETDAEITADELPRVEGDTDQLRQVFQNLVENAIEYSGDEPPRIHVETERDGDEWRLSVHDEGIGIDPEDHERIFEVFERLHTREEHSGTGIGLALCQRIVERHGGEIRVDSEPGEGTTFSFTLPAADADADADGDGGVDEPADADA